MYERELHVTTPGAMGVTLTLVSRAGQYLSGHQLDPSGRVAMMAIPAPLTLVIWMRPVSR